LIHDSASHKLSVESDSDSGGAHVDS
jgi:hypothetical protein